MEPLSITGTSVIVDRVLDLKIRFTTSHGAICGFMKMLDANSINRQLYRTQRNLLQITTSHGTISGFMMILDANSINRELFRTQRDLLGFTTSHGTNSGSMMMLDANSLTATYSVVCYSRK